MSNLWWGYKHVNGKIQAKRYFDKLDIQEALESPFCGDTAGPITCIDRQDALKKIAEIIKARKQKEK